MKSDLEERLEGMAQEEVHGNVLRRALPVFDVMITQGLRERVLRPGSIQRGRGSARWGRPLDGEDDPR